MDKTFEAEYWMPEHVREYLRGLGFVLPLEAMEGNIRVWHDWMSAVGDFYNYKDTDGFGRVYEVHRRSIHPAMRVCQEWGSLLLNDKTQVVCEEQACTDWLSEFFAKTGFMPAAQNTVVRAFGMGTGAWALWVDADSSKVRVKHYDARMVIPLSWDEEGVSECAFVTRVFYRGKAYDQLQMHLVGGLDGIADVGASPSQPSPSHGNGGPASPSESSLSRSLSASASGGTYRIVTALFDEDGNAVHPAGVCEAFDTGSPFPTFAIVRPAVDNTRVDMSPYGQSVFADAVDAIQAVDVAFDALVNEVDVSKMRIFLSDVLFDKESSGTGKKVTIPFGKNDCTVFRKVMSTEDMIQDFAPALRMGSQAEAFRIALQTLGDLCGFGISYFDLDESRGYVKTATEVASDSSALMRNIARHEHSLEVSLAGISRALLHCARTFGEALPDEGSIAVNFDDSIVTDTAAEKRLAMAEVGVTMHPWEYRARFYGEAEDVAKERARGLGAGAVASSTV
ncbi:MAG: hypothetical protein IJ087_06415 [Eggerthellaceae bacterium]|nr:hypothetical protein [Eggerthellaceae bacterium]